MFTEGQFEQLSETEFLYKLRCDLQWNSAYYERIYVSNMRDAF